MVSRFTTSRRLRKAPVFLHFLCAKQKTSEITSEMARLRIHDSTRTRPSLRYPGLREVSIHPGKWPCKRLCNGAVQSISWSVSPEVSCYQQLLHVCLGDPSRTVAVGCQTTGACGCHGPCRTRPGQSLLPSSGSSSPKKRLVWSWRIWKSQWI